MFASLTLLALAGSCAVSAAPVAKRDGAAIPTDYYEGYLEPYAAYHQRYLALSCQTQHNTTFFDSCCHPLLSTETLADRPAYCTPNATQNATEAANNASLWNATESDVGDCYNSTSSSVSASYAEATSSTIGQAAIQTQEVQQTSSTSTWEAPSSTSTWTAPAQTSSTSSGGDWVTGGDGTFFYQGGVAGSCGTVHSDSDYVAAMSSFGSYNEYCGKQIEVVNTQNGKSVTVTVADTCPTCNNGQSVDLSVAAFNAIADESQGMVGIKWRFT